MNLCALYLRRLRPVTVAVALGVTLVSCTDDKSVFGPTVRQPSALFWAVRLNHRATTMNVGSTLQLQATALNALNEPIPDLSTNIVYRSTDTVRVIVDAQGKVTARAAGNGIRIIATAHSDAQNSTNADTMIVNVTPTAATIASFSIQPDSTLIGAGDVMTLPTIIRTATGDTLRDVAIRYYTEKPAVLGVNTLNGTLEALDRGTVKIWAEATIYGQTFRDTVAMTVTYPNSGVFYIQNQSYGIVSTPLIFATTNELTVRKGATITFYQRSPTPVTITFTDPNATVEGNVPSFVQPQTAVRRFNNLGAYTFTVSGVAAQGKVTVVP